MTNARFLVHLDAGDDVVWWADSADLPGLSVAADTLAELRQLVFESASIHAGPDAGVTMHLADLETHASRTTPIQAEKDLPDRMPASHASGDSGFVSRFAA